MREATGPGWCTVSRVVCREPLPHCSFDVELLGDCDSIVNQLCLMLGEGWEAPVHRARLSQHTGLPPQLLRQDHEEQEAGFSSTAGPGASSDHSPTQNSISDTKDEGGEDVESNSNSQSKDSEREKPTPDGSNNDVDSDSEADDEDWKVKSLAESIPEGKFLFLPPARYVFIFYNMVNCLIDSLMSYVAGTCFPVRRCSRIAAMTRPRTRWRVRRSD